MIFDVHTHLACHKIFPKAFLAGVSRNLLVNDEKENAFITRLIINGLSDEDGSQAVKYMDAAGINRSVLLIADFGYSLGEPELSLEDMYRLHARVLNRYPDRFVVFGGVDPRRGRDGVDLFEKAIKEYHFGGLKLYPPCGFELDDPGLFPLYELCAEHGVPVLTHTGPSLSSMSVERRYPGTILKIAQQFPNVQFILAHGGARDWKTSVEVAQKRRNVSFDISAFQVDAPGADELARRFRYFFDHAPDQVLFGSDWPMFWMSAPPGKLVQTILSLDVLSSGELEKLFAINAGEIIGHATVQ